MIWIRTQDKEKCIEALDHIRGFIDKRGKSVMYEGIEFGYYPSVYEMPQEYEI